VRVTDPETLRRLYTRGEEHVSRAISKARGRAEPESEHRIASSLGMGGLGGAYRVSTEFVIFARRGSLREISSVRGTWFNWKRPYNEQGKPKHSAKPPAFFDMVEAVSPGPRLELFARERRPGWAAWGNEVESDIDIVDANERPRVSH
jgi:N6-adenosine-specific RNA methylase IME4